MCVKYGHIFDEICVLNLEVCVLNLEKSLGEICVFDLQNGTVVSGFNPMPPASKMSDSLLFPNPREITPYTTPTQIFQKITQNKVKLGFIPGICQTMPE